MNNLSHLFIVGNPLSGSSMLYRLLSYHRDLAWISQWSLRDGTVGPVRKTAPFARILDKWGRRFDHPWSKATYMKGLRWFTYRVIPSPADGGNIWEWVFPGLCQKHAFEKDLNVASGLLPVNNHGNIDDINRRLNHVVAEITRITGRKRFIGKRPILAYVMPIIKRLFPQSQFIHIVRDPRAFVLSWVKKNWKEFQQTKDIPKEVGGLEGVVSMMARYWVNTVISWTIRKSSMEAAL